MHLWDDDANRRLIANALPSFLPIYDGFESHIKRVDAVRYAYMYIFGGVYMDLDFTCLRSLDAMALAPGTVTLGYQLANRNDREAVANAFMAAPPRHPFFKRVLEEIPRAQRATRRTHPTEVTGGLFLTALVREWQARGLPGLQVLPIPLVYTSAWNAPKFACGTGRTRPPRLRELELDRCAARLNRSAVTTFWTHSWLDQWKADKRRRSLRWPHSERPTSNSSASRAPRLLEYSG